VLLSHDDPDNPGGNFALTKGAHKDGKKKQAIPSRHLLNWNVLVLASEYNEYNVCDICKPS